jgi:hypothetical protein
VLFDGEPVGHIEVAKWDGRRICGRLLPGPDFDRCRGFFEEAARLDRVVQAALDEGDAYHPAGDRYLEVIESITRRVTLPEVAQEIEEFAIDGNEEVEVFLYPSLSK